VWDVGTVIHGNNIAPGIGHFSILCVPQKIGRFMEWKEKNCCKMPEEDNNGKFGNQNGKILENILMN
jgi:hypothetical protein